LKLSDDKPPSDVFFKLNLRRCIKAAAVSRIKNSEQRHIHGIIDDKDKCRATLDPANPEMAAKAISAAGAGGLLGGAVPTPRPHSPSPQGLLVV